MRIVRSGFLIAAQAGIRRIDFLEIDAEKAELDVLQGIEDHDWKR